ncbi:hypothetical protein FOZ63_001087 [Perkinsus olseni]|uniref:Uncharacterized protein n=1 Tax=Perkinsus olseni TaxID=32597 RepID=A0A7J6QZN3_PEROL|nr:hypothetical protein FOZ62_005487 [Perkinsus olseni]KAF4754399.1 hypothetical protein FOZ63_001087 [Perkinsus olseni]
MRAPALWPFDKTLSRLVAYARIYIGFPLLVDRKIDPHGDFSWFTATCFYGNRDEYSEDWERTLIVNFRDHIGTQKIVCPKTGKREAFQSYFKWLESELDSFRVRGEKKLIFYKGVPANTGGDPLKALDDSTFRQTIADLKNVTKKGSSFIRLSGGLFRYNLLEFQVRGEKRKVFLEDLPGDTSRDPLHNFDNSTFRDELVHLKNITRFRHGLYSQLQPSFVALWRVCESVREAMAEKYGAFDAMCDVYDGVNGKAIEDAKRLHWTFREYSHQTEIYKRSPASWGYPF